MWASAQRALACVWIGATVVACGGGRDGRDARILPPLADAGVDAEGDYCNPIDDVGCNPGQHCSYVHELDGGLSEPQCVLSTGAIPLGGACTVTPGRTDDCVPRALCVDGTCEPTCGGGDCATGYCAYRGTACWAACDPLNPRCAPGKACYLPPPTSEGPGCAPIGVAVEGAACFEPNDCAPGLACALPTSRCAVICRVGGGAPACSGQETCVPRATGDPYGVCLP